PPEVRNKRQTVHVNVLRVHELEQACAAMGSAKPTLFHAAPRCLGDTVSVEDFIDHDCASVNAFGQPPAPRDVVGPNTRCQSVSTVVGEAHRIVLRLEGHDWEYRPKSFFTHHFHVVTHVGQNCRLKERT